MTDETPADNVSRRTLLQAVGLAAAGAAGLGASTTTGRAAEIGPADGRGSPPPGPDVLYDGPAVAPQLENASYSIWSADPLMVSGAHAYVDGEFLYQDFIYDDHGANTTAVPLAPPDGEPGVDPQSEVIPSSGDDGRELTDGTAPLGAPTGDVVYPTDDERYRDNAADLLEFRTRPVTDYGVLYRVTLNTMTAADVAGVAIGIDTGGDGGRSEWGYGLGELGDLDLDAVLVTWGDDAELVEADGTTTEVTSIADVERNQIEVRLPRDPGAETWRHYCVVGLFDTDAKQFKAVQPRPTENRPGGSHGTNPPPVFNVAFRSHDQEPMGAGNLEPGSAEREVAEATELGPRGYGFGHWREHAQARALARRDISEFHADVDFGVLRAGETAYSVPEEGYISRLYASRRPFEDEDVDFTPGEGIDGDTNTLTGRVQPYTVYVPSSYDGTPAPLLLDLHSHSTTYNEYAVLMPDQLRQLGEDRDSLMLFVEGRGQEGWWRDEAELDVFEAWADAAARYNIDFDRVSLTGYSMGGYGTYRLASLWPDLFAKGFAVVGPPDEAVLTGPLGHEMGTPQNALRVTENLRHVPLLLWVGTNDELVPLPGPVRYARKLSEAGYRHELDTFSGYDHMTFAYRDDWDHATQFLEGEFLGDATVERRPARVTYRAVPEMDSESLGLIHDGAYWVSAIEVVDGAESGLVDVESVAAGVGPPQTEAVRGGGIEPGPHVKRGLRWTGHRSTDSRNALVATLEDIAAATVWLEEAGLDPTEPVTIEVASTTEADLTLATDGSETTVTVGPGEETVTVRP